MGIRSKLLFPLIALGLSFAVILHVYWLPQFVSSETVELNKRELVTMEVVASTLTPLLLAGDLGQIHSTLDQLLERQESWKAIHLKTPDQRYLYPISSAPDTEPHDSSQWLSLPITFNEKEIAILELNIDIDAMLASQVVQIRALERLLLFLLLGIILLAALLQDRWIRRPLQTLVTATGRIADGDFVHNLPKVSTHDEVGQLITTFNTMRKNLKRRERKLGEQHALLHTIHTAQASFISDTDADGVFDELLEKILAVTNSTYGFIGETFYRDGKPYIRTFTTRDSTQMELTDLESPYGRMLLSSKPVIEQSLANEPRTDGMPDGTPVIDEFMGIPFLRNGTVIGMVGIANRSGGYNQDLVDFLQPVTSTCSHIIEALKADRQRLVAEDHIREREIRLRTIFENVVDGIVTTTDQGKIESYNNAAENIFGYSADEVIGRNASILIPSLYEDRHDRHIENQLLNPKNKKHGVSKELVGRKKDGTTFPLDITVNLMWVGGEKFYCSIMRDITERKKVDRMKNEFVSTVSHELRTPLTSIRGSLGLLCGGAAGELPQQALSLLNIAANNTERLLILINDILDIEKIESGQMSLKFKNVPVRDFLQQALIANESYAIQHNIKLELEDVANDLQIHVDPDRLMQVMNNLLSNAIKFSPEGATVEVGASCQDGIVRVNITDHGCGIPEEFQPSLFEKFTQSDASDTRKIGGTGLGLNITRAIIEKHGGSIDFTTRQDQGTTFFFELNAIPGTASSGELETLATCSNASDNRVLIVEDDPDVASLLRIMLAQAGFNADIALDARQAKQHLIDNSYIAVTMDIMLPDQDGISLIRELHEDEETKNLPIIVISAKADATRQELSGGALSIVDWLNKPIDQNRLLSAINQLVLPKTSPVILHVEDEPDVHVIISTLLKDIATVVWAPSLRAAQKQLADRTFDLALLDVCLPDGSATLLLDILNQHSPPIPTVLFSAQDIDQSIAEQVSAALVKSTTSNEALVDTIRSLLPKTGSWAADDFANTKYMEVNNL